jgi:hypothetical protein
MFSSNTPAAPQEDPQVAALRERERRRAEEDRARELQLQLGQETARRSGRGLQALLGPLGFGSLTSKLGSS